MKFTLDWLKEHLDTDAPATELAERLTMAGLEVKAVEGSGDAMVFELEITPNRPDWLSIIGIAREVAAIAGQRFKLPSTKAKKAAKTSSEGLDIRIDD